MHVAVNQSRDYEFATGINYLATRWSFQFTRLTHRRDLIPLDQDFKVGDWSSACPVDERGPSY